MKFWEHSTKAHIKKKEVPVAPSQKLVTSGTWSLLEHTSGHQVFTVLNSFSKVPHIVYASLLIFYSQEGVAIRTDIKYQIYTNS